VEGESTVPEREKRRAEGETDVTMLAGWYADEASGSCGSLDGSCSQESVDGLWGVSGK
jgi:hypothetical protein